MAKSASDKLYSKFILERDYQNRFQYERAATDEICLFTVYTAPKKCVAGKAFSGKL
jgi:hypothetical protein